MYWLRSWLPGQSLGCMQFYRASLNGAQLHPNAGGGSCQATIGRCPQKCIHKTTPHARAARGARGRPWDLGASAGPGRGWGRGGSRGWGWGWGGLITSSIGLHVKREHVYTIGYQNVRTTICRHVYRQRQRHKHTYAFLLWPQQERHILTSVRFPNTSADTEL